MATRKKQPLKTSLNERIDALFGGENQEGSTSSPATKTVSIDLLELPDYQPRQYFDGETIEQLATSIRTHGILEPLLVRPLSERKYEIVAGGRRYRAAQLSALTEVSVIVLNLNDNEALEIAILENLQRENLNPLEETEAILKLLSTRLNWNVAEVISWLYRLRNDSAGELRRNVSPNSEIATVETVFAPLGMTWKSFVETRLPLLKLPEEILIALQQGQIAYTKALAIAKLNPQEQRQELLAEAINQNLSLREIKEKIKLLRQSEARREPSKITLKSRMDSVYQKLKTGKIWADQSKRKKAERLLKQLENLVDN